MKKIFLIISLFSFSIFASLQAQVISSVMDAPYSGISHNGVYSYGNYEDIAFYYNASTGFKLALQGDQLDDGGCWVWDINDLGQLAVEHKKRAAIWTEQGGYELLPLPEGVAENAYCAARCITNDGKSIVVSIGSPTHAIYVYTLGEDGIFDIVRLPIPYEDPIFHQGFQFIAPCGIAEKGDLIIGRYRIDTGFEELPMYWKKDSLGEWYYEWMNLDYIVAGGKTDAVYPGEFEFDGAGYNTEIEPGQEKSEWQAEYDKAWDVYYEKLVDYYTVVYAEASGYFYSGSGDISGIAMSNNGRFVKMNISYQPNGYENPIANYPVVYEFATDSMYLFTCRPGAACLSVTDDGEVSLRGAADYFSWSYVSSIHHLDSATTLAAWTLNKSNGKIDLANYMTYNTPDGPRLAEGTATLATSGNGFVTWQYNGFEDNMRYESYFVRFDVESGVNNVVNSDLGVYPNPTDGILNISSNFTNVEIFDIMGRKVYSASEVESVIDLTQLSAGTYILMATDGSSKVSTKIIKQ